MLRSFTIADYGLLHRVKKHTVILNNRILLTRGLAALSRGAYLAPLSTLTGLHTFVSNDGPTPSLLQVEHGAGASLAYCTFMAPSTALETPGLMELLDAAAKQIGAGGGHCLVAEVEEVHPAFKALRTAGFSIYARQRVWKLTRTPESNGSRWRHALERDQLAIHLLRKGLVPGQVQQIESANAHLQEGYVLRHDGEILAYVEIQRGPHGIWVEPFVHLDTEPFDEALRDLMARLRPRTSRPVYVCLRSYQDWLQNALEDLGAQAGPRQVVMVKRTAIPLPVDEGRRVAVPNRSAEASTPIHAPQTQGRYETEWNAYDQTPNYR